MGNLVDYKIGIIPLPIFVVLLAVIAGFAGTGNVPSDILMAIVLLSMGGFTCAEIGKRIPILRTSAPGRSSRPSSPRRSSTTQLVPPQMVKAITDFTKFTNFLYIYIATIIVGSILGMDREVLIKGFLKIFAPLAIGSVAAALVGTLVGTLLGLGAVQDVLLHRRADHGGRRRRGRDPALHRLRGDPGPCSRASSSPRCCRR